MDLLTNHIEQRNNDNTFNLFCVTHTFQDRKKAYWPALKHIPSNFDVVLYVKIHFMLNVTLYIVRKCVIFIIPFGSNFITWKKVHSKREELVNNWNACWGDCQSPDIKTKSVHFHWEFNQQVPAIQGFFLTKEQQFCEFSSQFSQITAKILLTNSLSTDMIFFIENKFSQNALISLKMCEMNSEIKS